jgi:serine/threonine-protein kinase
MIAAGGMGAVYEVVHIETERRRALKIMHPHIVQSDELRERFSREAKVAAHIESDFIVDVFDAGFDEATRVPFLVMELLRGQELGKLLKKVGRFSPQQVVSYLHHAALALDKTHRAHIIHRDLKPENMFLTEREDGPPRVKVLDFGIAKIVAESATAGATQSVGTPLYMAPEQFDPRMRLSPSVDLYALAMVAYTFLVGVAYWADEARGGNVFALARVVGEGLREPASARAAARGVMLPPSFDAWFARATARDPAARFPSATEMVDALAVACGVLPPGRASIVALPQTAPLPAEAPIDPRALRTDNPGYAPEPPSAATGPGFSTTKRVPAADRRGIILVATIAAGVLLGGVGAFLGTRRDGSASGSQAPADPQPPASSASVEAPVETVAASQVPPPAPSAAPVATPAPPSAAPPAKAAFKPPPPPVPPPPPTKPKYTRD